MEGGNNSWGAKDVGVLNGCRSHRSFYDVQMRRHVVIYLHFSRTPVALKSVHQKKKFFFPYLEVPMTASIFTTHQKAGLGEARDNT